MSTTLRLRLAAAADSAAQAFEDALSAYLAERLAGDRLMDLSETGQRMGGWHASTVRRKHREGALPFPLVMVDGVLRARQSDVDAAIKELRPHRLLGDAVDPVRRPVRLSGLLRRLA